MESRLPPEYQYATQEQLAELYAHTGSWLTLHAPPFVEKNDVVQGTYDGWPVMQDGLRFDLDVSGEVLWYHCPEAARALELGDKLELSFWQPYYIRNNNTGRYEFRDSSAMFSINKSPASTLANETLFIAPEGEDDELWETDRLQEFKQRMANGNSMRSILHGIHEERRSGYTCLTQLETRSLMDIMGFVEQQYG